MTIDVEVKTLQKLAMFRDVGPSVLKLVAMTSDRVTFRKGDPIFRQGEPPDAAYIILDGDIRMSFEPVKDKAIALRHSGAILLGQVGILCGRARSMTTTAESTVTALRIPAEDFNRLIHDTPDFALAVMRELAEHLDAKTQYVADPDRMQCEAQT